MESNPDRIWTLARTHGKVKLIQVQLRALAGERLHCERSREKGGAPIIRAGCYGIVGYWAVLFYRVVVYWTK